MTEHELINTCRRHLSSSKVALCANNHEEYCREMSALLNLLMVELVGGASNETQTKIDNL